MSRGSEPMLGGQRVSWATLCQEALRQPVKSVQNRQIARLWSGYGSIQEVSAVTEDGQQHRLIVKQVDPPQDTGVSHERKLKSYAAEAAFYSHYSKHIITTAPTAAIAEALLVDVSPPAHFLFVLRDLRAEGFPEDKGSLDKQEAMAALDWLAAFHALWWEEVPGQDPPVSHHTPFSISAGSTLDPAGPQPPSGLWDCGCYWHLDTRQQEFASIPNSWRDVRDAAGAIDRVLKGQRKDGSYSNRHMTSVHGDFKAANLLWSSDGRCCAYDFQYVGKGLGMRDVSKFLCTAVDADVLEEEGGEQQLLQHYHAALVKQLQANSKAEAAQRYTPEVMTAQFEIALVDYIRFCAGWGFWGNVEWACARARGVLKRLDKVIAQAEK